MSGTGPRLLPTPQPAPIGTTRSNRAPSATGLQRRLSTGQLSMIAIGGAIGTGLFLGSGFAISLAGPAVLVSYAVGGLIALLLMGCLAEMTVVHPSTGSFGWLAQDLCQPIGWLPGALRLLVGQRASSGHGGDGGGAIHALLGTRAARLVVDPGVLGRARPPSTRSAYGCSAGSNTASPSLKSPRSWPSWFLAAGPCCTVQARRTPDWPTTRGSAASCRMGSAGCGWPS